MTLLKKTLWEPGSRFQNLVKLTRATICVVLLLAISFQVRSVPHYKKQPKLYNVADTTIRGRITDSSGAPVAGVSVLIKGTKRGAFTDASGDFELPGVSPRATLVISNVGYQTAEVRLAPGQTRVSMSLYREAATLAEVVVTGFQQIEKKKFTGAAVTLKADDVKIEGITDVGRLLEGRAAGAVS